MAMLRAVIEESTNERIVASISDLEHTLEEAHSQARAAQILNIISLTASNGDSLFLVVGGDETVAGFNYGTGMPPYYVSKGPTLASDPPLIAFLGLVHHTEFARRYVIPMDDGRRAALEFLSTGGRPLAIEWVET